MQVQKLCLQAIRDGIVRSAHDVSEGGLAVALAESCISAPEGAFWGAEIEIEAAIRPDAWLFGESQSRILVSVRRKHLGRLRDLATQQGVPFAALGEIRGRRLRIGNLIDVDARELYEAWGNSLARRIGG
jgi:phosphoribosylformylglycinamidine synthase